MHGICKASLRVQYLKLACENAGVGRQVINDFDLLDIIFDLLEISYNIC